MKYTCFTITFISNLEDIIVDKNTIAKKEHVPKLLRSLKKGNYTALQIQTHTVSPTEYWSISRTVIVIESKFISIHIRDVW